ncbi:MAG: adenylate cyclase regulatory domain-containing protein [Solirubrobacterales bacterium]
MDFTAEGLLDGLEGDQRRARVELLTRLLEAGVSIDELKQAVADNRLALLPAERLMTQEEKYSIRDLARIAGVDEQLLLSLRRASGLPIEDPDEVAFGDLDLEAARAIALFVEAGLPRSGLVEMSRIFGELTARTAAATRALIAETFAGGELDEYSLSVRLAEVARDLRPLTVSLIEYLYRLHMREQMRNEIAISAQVDSGSVPGLQEVSACFVDLVGFTGLGESIPPEELGGLVGRLASMVSEAVAPPVRLTKMIGDAGMLVSEDTDALLDVALRLIDVAEQEDGDFPGLKVGVARGKAIHRWGDWYGSPVNIANRVTGIARPGSVLVTGDVHEAATGEYRWSFAGERHLKGVQREVTLYRVRRAEA